MHTKDFQLIVRNFHVARLTLIEAATFRAIHQWRGDPPTITAIADRVYASNDGPSSATANIAVFLANIRRKLAPLNICIDMIGRTYTVRFR